MLTLRKVAVTGGLSSGKSQFCSYLLELGAYVVSADKIVHQLLSPETDLGNKVINLLGSDIVVNGKIDRTSVAKHVFNDPKRLHSLEKIIHPAVMEYVELEYQQASKQKSHPLFVVEIPLLFEAKASDRFDQTIAIIADEESCIQRFSAATGQERNEYLKRSQRQLPQSEKAALADIVIENNGSLEDLKNEAQSTFRMLTNNFRSH